MIALLSQFSITIGRDFLLQFVYFIAFFQSIRNIYTVYIFRRRVSLKGITQRMYCLNKHRHRRGIHILSEVYRYWLLSLYL